MLPGSFEATPTAKFPRPEPKAAAASSRPGSLRSRRVRVEFFSTLLLPFVAACGPPRPEWKSTPPPPVLTFEMQTREMTYEDCVAGSEGCTYIRFDYPTVVDAPLGATVEAVTSAIDSFLEAPFHHEEPPTSMNALMARFLSEYAAFKASVPKSEQSWFLERKAFVLRSAPNLLSLSFSERSYLGGAHGLATVHYLNLDPVTGDTKVLTDLLKDGALPEAIALAEARLRQVRGIAAGTTLKDAGFTFQNDAFVLPEDFALRDDGLAFYYNPSDVAPHSMGATEIVLSRDEIRSLLKPEYAQTGTTAPPQREQ